MRLKQIAFAFGFIAIGSSGAYLFIYLYRWEWNRALMAGVFLIAAEVALAAAAILDRIKSLERSISPSHKAVVEQDTLARIRDAAAPTPNHFGWLEDTKDLGVFIPFLMGAGLIASAVAWAVEKIAASTAVPVFERGLALRLAPISLPRDGNEPALPPKKRLRFHRQAVALAGAILIGTVGLDVLADATQTRPDLLRAGTRSAILLEVELRGGSRLSHLAIDALWGACSGTVPNELSTDGVRALGNSRYAISVEPALGKYGERRLRGCLQDATIDNVQARVLGIST